MKAIRLKTEYLFEPIGIDIEQPRLFWNCEGGVRQTAYQIAAADDARNTLWDSGKVVSSSMRCTWGGKPVPPRTRVNWRVRLWDEHDAPGDWSESTFETGLPKGELWQAKWIAGNYVVDKKQRYPVDCFRKVFSVTDVKKARLYITACGVYEACINGQRVGDFILAPGITDYRRRIQYQTYDVTDLLKSGENEITVWIADGWYRGSCGAWGHRNQYGTQTKLLAQLEMTDIAGRAKTVCTDESWQWSADGPIRFAENKDGEIVDARMMPSYAGHAFLAGHHVVPTASNNVPVREGHRFSASLITTPKGKTVLDFGQNIAGYASFRVNAKAGQKITLRFGEMLDRDGEFTQANIQCSNKKITTPLQRVIYTCRDGVNEYKTRFAIFGFQYVLVEADFPVDPADFTAIAVSSAMEETSSFDSSNDLLNRFYQATLWSARNNACDLPTDCPTRERHGWTGDAQIFCSTASYLFDYMTFGQKYLNDMYDWQKRNGKLPQIAPEGGVDFYMKTMDGSVGWSDAGIIIPYVLWKQYGDAEILRKYLPGMRKYAAFMQRRCGKWYPTAKRTGLRGEKKKYLSNYGQAYGEWAEPADVHAMTWKDCAVPHPEVATAYTAWVLGIMAEICEILGKTEPVQMLKKYSEGAKKAYQEMMEKPRFSLDTDRQAKLVRPLYMDLLNEEQTAFAKKRLIKALENYNWRLGTGFLSTPLIMDVLAEINIEAAYCLLENEELPGWLSMPKNGAMTIWEAWEGPNTKNGGIASLDHYSKGAVCRWLFDTMCGIRVDGENHFTVAPRPGGHFTHAKASYDSVYGQVSSGWSVEDGKSVFTVTVPANCTAQVILPDVTEQMQEPGRMVYTI